MSQAYFVSADLWRVPCYQLWDNGIDGLLQIVQHSGERSHCELVLFVVHFLKVRQGVRLRNLNLFSLLNPDEPIWRVCQKDGWTDVCSPVKTAAGLRCGLQDLCPWRSQALLRHDGPPRKTIVPTLVSCKPDLSEAVGWKLYEMTRRFVSAWRRVRESWKCADTVRGSDRRPEEFPTSRHIPFGIGNCTAAFDQTEVQIAYSLSPIKNLQQSLATAVKPRSL